MIVKWIKMILATIILSNFLTADKPNILLILADDLGWGDVSYNNPECIFKTPNIDRIGEHGLKFTNAYTPHSVCTPTRYALLTGRYAWRTELREGVLPGYGKSLIRPERINLASMLKAHGYRTGVFGKWHLGLDWTPKDGDPGDWHWGTQILKDFDKWAPIIASRVDHKQPVKVGPTHLGFDEVLVTPSNCMRLPLWLKNDKIVQNYYLEKKDFKKGFLVDPSVQNDTIDDLHVNHALGFLHNWKNRYSNQPFFLYLPLNAIHGMTKTPMRFQGQTKDGLRGDKVMWVDESVKKVLDALENLKVSDNTLVIFTSDNGPIPPSKYHKKTKHQAAGPYKGYKTDIWDGGFKVPFFIRWPEKIKQGVNDDLICITDIFSTIADLLEYRLPKWSGEDSISFYSTLFGLKQMTRANLIMQSNIGALAIRQNQWKLILYTKGSGGPKTPSAEPLNIEGPWGFMNSKTGQLYNLEEDPYEENDLYDQHLNKVQELQSLLYHHIGSGRSN